MKLTKGQVYRLAKAAEIKVELPEDVTEKALWPKYHLDVGDISDSDENGDDLFWNEDLRSHCGFVEDRFGGLTLVVFPQYYAEWNPEAFMALLKDAVGLEYRYNAILPFNKVK